jgi:hypothetical protein
MGEQFVNYQFKSNSQENVVNAIRCSSLRDCYVSPSSGGWVTVYDRLSEDFRDRNLDNYVVETARSLSSNLDTAAFAFVVLGGINFLYFVFDKGELIDEFYDDPANGYHFGFHRYDQQVSVRYQGCPGKIMPYFQSEVTVEQITHILKRARTRDANCLFGEDVIHELAPLMGIDESRAIMGFRYFETEISYPKEKQNVQDLEDYVCVQNWDGKSVGC